MLSETKTQFFYPQDGGSGLLRNVSNYLRGFTSQKTVILKWTLSSVDEAEWVTEECDEEFRATGLLNSLFIFLVKR
jgi:hypothetical protein